MNTDSGSPNDVRRARRAFLLVGLVIPVVIALIAVFLIVAWLPDLPSQVVTHWGPDGPDGFGSPEMYIWMQVLVGLGIPLLVTLPVLVTMRESWGLTGRLLGAISLGVSVLIAVASAGSVAIQREGAEEPGLGAVLAIGFGGMLVLGVAGWFAQPRVTSDAAPTRSSQLKLAPGERAAWFGTSAMGRPGVVFLVLAVLLLIVTTVWVFVMDDGTGWFMAAVTLLVIVLIASSLVFRVRINAEGLRVRSIAGWPRWSIPASEIDDSRAVHVHPLSEFGGWGVRIAVDGRRGIVLRTGEGLQVTRRSGRIFVVTIDDARTAAAVLNAVSRAATNTPDRGESA